jgi:hypothetical protein
MLHTKFALTRGNQVTEMLRTSVQASVVAAFVIIAVTGCDKKRGEAVVLAKEYIDAAPPTAETPNAQSATTPEAEIRPMADDEIAVDGYVMKPEARGTSRDPRALKHQQWIVKVRMVDDGRTFQARPIKQDGRNCARTTGSKSSIAQANTPELFGPPRLSDSSKTPGPHTFAGRSLSSLASPTDFVAACL